MPKLPLPRLCPPLMSRCPQELHGAASSWLHKQQQHASQAGASGSQLCKGQQETLGHWHAALGQQDSESSEEEEEEEEEEDEDSDGEDHAAALQAV